MSEPPLGGGVGIVLVVDGPVAAAVLADCVRVGVGALRGDPGPAVDADVLLLAADQGPRTLVLGADPVAELATHLAGAPAGTLAVGGADVRALLAGLAAGAHLHVRAAGNPRAVVQAAARAAALARLAGRAPLGADALRSLWT